MSAPKPATPKLLGPEEKLKGFIFENESILENLIYFNVASYITSKSLT